MPKPQSTIERYGVAAVVPCRERLLVIKRSQQVLAPGMFCFPGGGIEGSESEADAVRRELEEELQVAVEPRRRLWHVVTSWRVSLAFWLAELPAGAAPLPNPEEVESIHWHTPQEITALPSLLESNGEFIDLVLRGEIRLDAG